jgi:hypothetical protein
MIILGRKNNAILAYGGYMKKLSFLLLGAVIMFTACLNMPEYTGQNQHQLESTFKFGHFELPAGAELLESTEFKNDDVPYMVERRYRLPSGQIMYAYYDVEGSSSVTMQRIEESPLLTLGVDINISGMPGYREFNFGDDRRRLVQFMKLFKLGKADFMGRVKTPSLSDLIFRPSGVYEDEFLLLLDLYDETWVLEHRYLTGRRIDSTSTTAIIRVDKFNDNTGY